MRGLAPPRSSVCLARDRAIPTRPVRQADPTASQILPADRLAIAWNPLELCGLQDQSARIADRKKKPEKVGCGGIATSGIAAVERRGVTREKARTPSTSPLVGDAPGLQLVADVPSCANRQFLVGGPMLAQLPVTGSPASVFLTKGTE